jgi:hypothetical protein
MLEIHPDVVTVSGFDYQLGTCFKKETPQTVILYIKSGGISSYAPSITRFPLVELFRDL